MKQQTQIKIYEQETVYGDESKFGKNSNRLEKMLQLINSLEHTPEKILDLGCGTGFLSHRLKKIFPKSDVYGMDISRTALTDAKKKYPDVIFTYGNAEKKLPFHEHFFDLVISGEQIEHIVDTDTYLVEINRVMKINGKLIVTTPNLASWLNRILLLLGKQPYKTEASLRRTLPILKVFNFTFPEKLSTPASGHVRVFTLDILIKLLAVYGFKIQKKLGRTMLTKPILRQVDKCISSYPALASGLVVQVQKKINALPIHKSYV